MLLRPVICFTAGIYFMFMYPLSYIYPCILYPSIENMKICKYTIYIIFIYIYNKYKEEIGHIYMNFLVYKNRKTQCIRKLGLTCRLCTIQSLREPFILLFGICLSIYCTLQTLLTNSYFF